jgi:predicted small integral membrane protein
MLLGMAFWEYKSPGGDPRVGVLRIETTRGDRLFISLLGSAFIHIAWLGLTNLNLWWALAVSLVYAFCVFKYV